MLGKTALGKYRIERLLGEGSNAEVFLAEPTRDTGPRVVIKRIREHIVQHPNFRQTFDAEVRSMANFSHPYAVQFLEADIDDPFGPCLAMEYVHGIALDALIRRNRSLDAERVGRLLGHLCHALQAAHNAGVIHRDLKPANLMVQNPGTTIESLKVMDFGFAGFAAKPHIQLANLIGQGPIHAVGTPAYVSPEMIRGDTVDHRSDLYAVGIILYELLTGRLPFTTDDIRKLLAAHTNEPPPRFAKAGAKHISPAVEEPVLLALSKYPNERPQSARALAELYGKALGENYWEATAPVGWEPLPRAADYTPARVAPDLPRNPLDVSFRFDAFVGERLVAAKLRGFVEDLGGQVTASEPGLIRMRLGVPTGYKESSAGGSGIINWFRAVSKPSVTPGQEPIEVELNLDKPDPAQPRLAVLARFRPLKDYPPANARTWRERCDKLNTMLRQYLGAQ